MQIASFLKLLVVRHKALGRASLLYLATTPASQFNPPAPEAVNPLSAFRTAIILIAYR